MIDGHRQHEAGGERRTAEGKGEGGAPRARRTKVRDEGDVKETSGWHLKGRERSGG